MPHPELFDSVAMLLRYPNDSYAHSVEICEDAVQREGPEFGKLLKNFRECTSSLTTEAMQELFTQTFDLNPVCSLELGWHLFGEQYERGEFLVKMRQQMRRFEIPESAELPDHLPHVLAVLGRMELEEGEEFAGMFVFPALDKMRKSLTGTGNPFEFVLDLVARVVESRYARRAGAAAGPPVLRVLQERGLQ